MALVHHSVRVIFRSRGVYMDFTDTAGMQYIKPPIKRRMKNHAFRFLSYVDSKAKTAMSQVVGRTVKCVAVGDIDAGKSALLHACLHSSTAGSCGRRQHHHNLDEYTPGVFDDCTVVIDCRGDHLQGDQQVNLILSDTSGQEQYDRLRHLSYLQTDVFLICFSLVSRTGLRSVQENWYPELRLRCPDAAFILVGTQVELRDEAFILTMTSSIEENISCSITSSQRHFVTQSEGAAVAKAIGAVKYIECSALTQLGVGELLAEAASTATMRPLRGRQGWRAIMRGRLSSSRNRRTQARLIVRNRSTTA